MKHFLRHSLNSAWRQFLHLFAPPYCTTCRTFLPERTPLCDPCKRSVRPLATVTIQVTQKYGVRVFAAGPYRAPLAPLVLAKSSSNRTASVQLGHLVWHMTDIRNIPFDI